MKWNFFSEIRNNLTEKAIHQDGVTRSAVYHRADTNRNISCNGQGAGTNTIQYMHSLEYLQQHVNRIQSHFQLSVRSYGESKVMLDYFFKDTVQI